jgi:hypothetical protein
VGTLIFYCLFLMYSPSFSHYYVDILLFVDYDKCIPKGKGGSRNANDHACYSNERNKLAKPHSVG